MFFFDHVFGLDDKSLFKVRAVLWICFGQPVGESLVMNTSDCIVFALGIAELNVIEFIETSEYVQYNDAIATYLVSILIENSS